MTEHPPASIEHLGVVIPARNEGERLAACLTSVREAVLHLRETRGPLRARVVLVLDSCTDDSREVAGRFSEVTLVHTLHSNVGAARAAGVDRALDALRGLPERTWIANTDADSTVPRDWLVEHLAAAEQGFDVALGAVVPVVSELTRGQRAAWELAHPGGPAPGNIHGANLGFRASAYLAVGGFEPLYEHEDVGLVTALSSAGIAVGNLGGSPVTTSGRSVGRTPGGYARYLAGLDTVAVG